MDHYEKLHGPTQYRFGRVDFESGSFARQPEPVKSQANRCNCMGSFGEPRLGDVLTACPRCEPHGWFPILDTRFNRDDEPHSTTNSDAANNQSPPEDHHRPEQLSPDHYHASIPAVMEPTVANERPEYPCELITNIPHGPAAIWETFDAKERNDAIFRSAKDPTSPIYQLYGLTFKTERGREATELPDLPPIRVQHGDVGGGGKLPSIREVINNPANQGLGALK